MKKVRAKDFINYFIEKILEKNYEMTNYNQLYIIIDNINSEKHFEVFKKIDYKYINQVKIFIVINIYSYFGQKKFI